MTEIKVDTKIILAIITIVDLVWGSEGALSLALWVAYGLYKYDDKINK